MKTRNLALTILTVGFVFLPQQQSKGEKPASKPSSKIKQFETKCASLVIKCCGEKSWQKCREVVRQYGYLDGDWLFYGITTDKETRIGYITFGMRKSDPTTHKRVFITSRQVYYDCQEFISPDGKLSVFRKGDNAETSWYVRNLETGQDEMVENGSFCHDCSEAGESSVFRGWSPSGDYMLFLNFSPDYSNSEQAPLIRGSLAIYSTNGLIKDQNTRGLGRIDVNNCDWQNPGENIVSYHFLPTNNLAFKTSTYSVNKSRYMKEATQAYNQITANYAKIQQVMKREWAKTYPQVALPDNFDYYWFQASDANARAIIGFEGSREFRGNNCPIQVQFDLNLNIIKIATENSG